MTITITGWLQDYRPLVRCRIAAANIADGRLADGGDMELIALVDTGATDCHIREETRAALGLLVTEEVHTVNIGAAGLCPVVRIDVALAGVDENGLSRNFRATGARTFIGEFDGAVDMILGMNVLRLLQELRIAGGVPTLVAAG